MPTYYQMIERPHGTEHSMGRARASYRSAPLSAPRAHLTLYAAFWGVVMAFLFVPALALGAGRAPESFADLTEEVRGAVVNITVSATSPTNVPNNAPMPRAPKGSPFEHFFDDFFDQNQAPQRPRRGIGSGFIISPDGYIVTNDHVISGANKIEIELFSGESLDAKLIGTDPNTDIALLKVTADEPLPYVQFGDSNVARVGDWVMAVGNPLGQGFSVSVGIISARNRFLNGAYDDFIQTDAAINQGNSGGPLFNMEGEVIGVNTSIISPSGGSVGIGFAMSSAVVTKVVDQLKAYGQTRRGWLGVQIQPLTEELREAWGLKEGTTGVVVTAILEGPARDAGIEVGDVIYLFENQTIKDSNAFVRMVSRTRIGKRIELKLYRDGKKKTISLKLAQREKFENRPPKAVQDEESQKIPDLGLQLAPLDDGTRQKMGLSREDGGVLIKNVASASLANRAALFPGNVILRAGGAQLFSPSDFHDQIERAQDEGRKSVVLLILSERGKGFVALSLE